MSDDETDELSQEELRAVTKAWRELVEDKAHNGRLHYTMPPVRGMPAPGFFKIPRNVFEALGDGDLKVGGAVAHAMFGIETTPGAPTSFTPTRSHHRQRQHQHRPSRVGEVCRKVRRQSREGVTLEHDGLQHEDGHHDGL